MKFLLGVLGALLLTLILYPVQNAAAQNVNNFRISSFDIQYELSRDADNRSVLKTVEIIAAEFPSFNQNHGLERSLPISYDGHPLHLDITSVTDGNGIKRQYSTDTVGDMLTMRIGDPNSYVYGTQVYVISYTQHDVTKYFADNGRDEWYWDTNGTQWAVPIDELIVSSSIDENLLKSRIGESACYRGRASATTTCTLNSVGMGQHSTFANNLNAGENVTIAIGFQQGTFAAYQPSLWERIIGIWGLVLLVTAFVGLVVLIVLIVAYSRRRNRTREIDIVPVEYIPPKATSVLVSSQILSTATSIFSAQLIDLAVRHFIEIIEIKPQSAWKAAEYDIKCITDPARLLEEDRETLTDMYGHLPVVGDRLALSTLRNNASYFSRTRDNDKKLKVLVEDTYALREKSPKASKYFYRWSIVLLILGVLTFSPIFLALAGMAALQGHFIRPLTNKGLELRRYLLGLIKYIKAAEVERLKFLQGPDTAQKIGETIDVNNPGQLVKLYERVLPYAILFGFEKAWSRRLGEYYETAKAQPDWYVGNAVFSAAVFSSTLSSFSTAASYSGGASASSSSGSSGGGASGGGGGGGGGGGW